jgi:hypothetical protein
MRAGVILFSRYPMPSPDPTASTFEDPQIREAFTRRDAAKILGISRRRVEQLQASGKLVVYFIGPTGTIYYKRSDVVALCAGRPKADLSRLPAMGSIAAEIFTLFRETCDLSEIVIRTRQPPQLIRHLYEEFRRPLGAPEPTREARRGFGSGAGNGRELEREIRRLQKNPMLSIAPPPASSDEPEPERASG